MGNCLRREESVVPATGLDVEKERLLWINTTCKNTLASFSSSLSSYSSPLKFNNRGMKIRITKEELEEMLGRVNMQDVTVDQVLSGMLNSRSVDGFEHHIIQRQQYSWRPRLQRIPEVY